MVDNELQKVLSRFESVNSHSQETLDNAIKTLENIQQELQQRNFQQHQLQNYQQEFDTPSQTDDLIASTGLKFWTGRAM